MCSELKLREKGDFPGAKIKRRIACVQKYMHWNSIYQDCPPPASPCSINLITLLLTCHSQRSHPLQHCVDDGLARLLLTAQGPGSSTDLCLSNKITHSILPLPAPRTLNLPGPNGSLSRLLSFHQLRDWCHDSELSTLLRCRAPQQLAFLLPRHLLHCCLSSILHRLLFEASQQLTLSLSPVLVTSHSQSDLHAAAPRSFLRMVQNHCHFSNSSRCFIAQGF